MTTPGAAPRPGASRRVTVMILAAVLTATAATAAAAAPPVGAAGAGFGGRHPGTLLVALNAPMTPDNLAALPNTRVVRRLSRVGLAVVRADDVDTAAAAYKRLPGVRAVEPDRVVHAAAVPNDPLYPRQWNLAPATAANRGTTDWQPVFGKVDGTGALVAVIDSGMRTGGSDQPVNIRTDLARNVIDGTNNVTDDFGHGTFITDIIAGATDNATGAAGIAPGAAIIPIKALDATGSASLSTVAAGIDYAVGVGAKVINLSLASAADDDATDPGDTGDAISPDPALCASIQAVSTRAVVVAATGNDSRRPGPTDPGPADIDPVADPADCPTVLAVGGVRIDGTVGPYSNAGCAVAVVAPGGDPFDLATNPNSGIAQQGYDANPSSPTFGTFQYFSEAGTSMAAAQVSAEAALLVGMGADVVRARRAIVATARNLGPSGHDPSLGDGAIDIAGAVLAVGNGDVPLPPARGYRTLGASGGIRAFGDGCSTDGFQGQPTAALARPAVGLAATPAGRGYWVVAGDGGIFAFGDAPFLGSTGALHLNQPIVGMAATPSGRGYWLVARDGGIFSYGDAPFLGSTGAIHLNQPIVGMAATPSGRGYWLVAADGGIFNYGDAPFLGSTGAIRVTAPIVGMAGAPRARGYWLVAADGGIFAFGTAVFAGSTGAIHLNQPIVGMVASSDGRGYWLAAADGGVFNFGNAPFFGAGSDGGRTVAIAPAPDPRY